MRLFLAAAALCGALSPAFAEDAQPSSAEPATAPAAAEGATAALTLATATEADKMAALEMVGWLAFQELGLNLPWNEDELQAMLRGMRVACEGGQIALDQKYSGLFGEMVQEKQGAMGRGNPAAARPATAPSDPAANAAYFASLDSDPKVEKRPSGLYVEVQELGTGPMATFNDEVTVHYTGRLIDGTVFDSSHQRGAPATFPAKGVIAGFGEALTTLPVGTKARIHIPPSIGYGDRDLGSIPPNSVLVFEIEIISRTELAPGLSR